MGREKIVDGVDENKVDQNKLPNGDVQNKQGTWQNPIFPFFNKT